MLKELIYNTLFQSLIESGLELEVAVKIATRLTESIAPEGSKIRPEFMILPISTALLHVQIALIELRTLTKDDTDENT